MLYSCRTGQKPLTFTSALIVIVLTLPSAAEQSRDKGKEIRTELASLQNETGVTLSAFALSVGTLQFSHRSRFKEEELEGPAAHSQDGDVSSHGTKVAFGWSYYIDALRQKDCRHPFWRRFDLPTATAILVKDEWEPAQY